MSSDSAFRPVLYLKDKCPFCLKILIMLLEAGKLSDVEVQTIRPGTEEDRAARALLSSHFDTVTFPAAQVAPNHFIKDSDALLAHFSQLWDNDLASLTIFNWYNEGPFAGLGALYKENLELKAKLAI